MASAREPLNEAWKELIADAMRRNVVVSVGIHRDAIEREARADLLAENKTLRAALDRIAFTDAERYWAQDEARRALALGGIDWATELNPNTPRSPAALEELEEEHRDR